MKTFLKKLAGFSLGPIIAAIISFVTVPLTTYFISPEEFGKSGMFTMVLTFINMVLYLGMDQSYAREYHEIKDKSSLFFNATIMPLCISIALCCVVTIFKEKISLLLFGSSDYGYISIILGIMLMFSVLERFILMKIRMEEKALEYSLFSIFVKVTVLVTLLLLLKFSKPNFLTIVYSTIFGQIIGDLYLIYRYKHFFSGFSLANFDKVLIKKMAIFGFPLLIAVSLNSFLNALGTFSVRTWSTFYELGIYTAGQRIANFLNIIQLAFTSFWIPTAYRWYKDKREIENFKLVSDLLLLIMTLGYFVVVFLKKYIVVLLSSDYTETKYVISFLVLVPILYTLSETTTLGIVFSKKSYLNIVVSVFSVLACCILNVALVPKFGNRGAAIAISVAYFLFFMLRSFFSKKNGFGFSLTKQYLVIFILFLTSILNLYNISNINYYNLLLFTCILITQFTTLKQINNIRLGKGNFNLN